LGVPVRIAHRIEDEEGQEWHFAMTGMISLAPPPESDGDQKPAEDQI
jgi:hypothetical protein